MISLCRNWQSLYNHSMKVPLLICLFFLAQSGPAAQRGFQQLFNGRDLTGWVGGGGTAINWKIEKGALLCTGQKQAQWIFTEKQYANFDLRFEFNIPKNGNSGVFIRAPKEGAPWVEGMEIQVLDDYGDKWENLKSAQFTGSIYAVQAPEKRVTKKAGEWQTMRVRCTGPKCNIWINGEQVMNGDLEKLVQTHNQAGLKRHSGFIGL